MAAEEHAEMFVEGLIDQHGAEQVGSGYVVTNRYDAPYWVNNACITQLSDLPGSVGEDVLEEDSPIIYLCEHWDGMFAPLESRWIDFARALDRNGIGFTLQEDLTPDSDAISIPVEVAREGQKAMYAYLAAHGFTNSEIADEFRVKYNTVKVNLSQYKSA
jgi:hypothetical protein